jgi:large subunit ribosomal protein L1
MPVKKEAVMNALEDAKKLSKKREFTQSIDLIVNLKDLDLKKPKNRVNELVEVSNPIGKTIKICIIAGGDLAVRAKKAGADRVIAAQDLEALSKDKKAAKQLENNFDFFIAEAQLMPQVGKSIGAVLGPRGKMPTPVPTNAPIGEVIKKYRRMIRIMVKGQLNTQTRIGIEDMENEKIAENVQAIITRLENKLEKGQKNIRSLAVKMTMGPPVKIEF